MAMLYMYSHPDALHFSDHSWISITLAMVGKFCISGTFAILYIYTAEMYPTNVRTLAVGSGSVWARVGGILAPYLAQMVCV